MTLLEPLPRAEVIKAAEHRNPRRIPLIMAKWWGEGFSELHGETLTCFNRYPEDALLCLIEPFRYEEMNLPWELNLTFLLGFDVQQILASGRLEEVRAKVRHLIDTFDRPDPWSFQRILTFFLFLRF